eukprot:429411_1
MNLLKSVKITWIAVAQEMCRMMCVISAGSAANWIDRSAWWLKYSDFVGKVDEYQDADGDIEMHQDKKKMMTDLVRVVRKWRKDTRPYSRIIMRMLITMRR